jgi:hypothetical protein
MMWRKMLLVGLIVSVLSQVSIAQTTETQSQAPVTETKETHYWADGGWGLLAAVATMPYAPAKVVYAAVGTVTGGLAYILTAGDFDTAQRVWSPSVGGSYVITPAMLRGDEPLLFNGPSYSSN